MKILITGHQGFIGSYLTKCLSEKYEITGIDIKEGKDIRSCHLPKDIDLVIHLAGKSGVRESLSRQREYYSHNVTGSKRIFNHYQPKRILYASSSSVYEPMLNPYAMTKYEMEKNAPANSLGMRIHTVYSEKPREGMLIYNILNNKIKYGTNHSRDFLHLDDLLKAIQLLIHSTETGYIDIGTGISVPVKEILKLYGINDVPLIENTIHERKATKANITRLKELGFNPKYDILEFIKKVRNAEDTRE